MLGAQSLTTVGTGTLIGGLVTAFGATLGTLWKAQQSRDRQAEQERKEIAAERKRLTDECAYWRSQFFKLAGLPPDQTEKVTAKVKEVVEHVDDDDG